jgi:cytochrome c oxidase subunit 3
MPIEAFTAEEQRERQQRAYRTLLKFGIVSIIMLFAGLTSAYIVRQGEGKWVQFDLPPLFVISTVLIVLSSIPMQLAVREIKRDNFSAFKIMIWLTALLGAGFVLFQYFAWTELISRGLYFVGHVKDINVPHAYIPSGTETVEQVGDMGNVAASFLYVITGLHVVHLFGGIIALAIVLSYSYFGKYSSSNYNGVQMCATYWHFLTGLWVYLFLFLNYIR